MNTVGGRLVGFKRHLQAAVVPGEAAYLVSARGVTALRGRSIEILAPLLDGSRTVEAIVRDAAPDLRADQVGAVLGRLAEADVLAVHTAWPEPARTPDCAYWDLAGLDGEAAAHAVTATPVELVAAGEVDLAPVRAALRGSGLTTDAGAGAALCITLCEDYLVPELAAIDRARRAEGRPWLLAKISGPEPWVGPFFRPGQGPCWHCLAHRLELLRQPELRARRALAAGKRPPETSIEAARAVSAQLIVLEAAKWLAGVREESQGSVYTLDTITLRGEHHPVARRPQCPECGDPALVAERAAQPIRPRSRPAGACGSRGPAVDEVYHAYRHLVDPVTGVVRGIRADPSPHEGVYRSVASTSVLVQGAAEQGGQLLLRTYSGGRGATALEARVGALGEAVERYCACRQGDEAVVRAAYRDLGPVAVHPDSCQLFDPRQYADRERWNRRHGSEHWVCEPFDEARVREWTPVWSLTGERQRLVPTSLLYLHYGRPGSCTQIYADSNGNAAGASLEEAVLQGFLELVERDAVAMWWYNRVKRPGIDLEASADPLVTRIRQSCEQAGRPVWALDLTTDLGVPVVAALSADLTEPEPTPRLGFGAHFDADRALRRAMAELVQVSGPARDAAAQAAAPARRYCDGGIDPYLLPWPPQERRAGEPCLSTPRTDLRDRIEDVLALLGRRGLELMVLDQTRPDIGMPVVKVLVPGLRPMRARFAPGRLFDVPVRLGWLPEPTPYHRLNPIPLAL
jgi:ribosomal protein S12 methylthiotransferase accessory factor